MRNTFIIIAAASAALVASPSVALASPANATDFSATVEHDDIDLTTERGVARLDERVRTEIRRACANGGRDSASIRLERQCRTSAFAATQTQVRIAIAEANADTVRFAATSKASNADTPGA